ncbi:unnamed protein product [Hapterophycus canaliculatus]
MSLIESLSKLREELPLARRAAPKRVLLEHYLRHEHVLLHHLSAADGVLENLSKHDDPFSLQGPSSAAGLNTSNSRSWSGDRRHLIPSRSKRVEDMFRKARLRRCFARIMRHQRGVGEDLEPRQMPVVASPSGPVLHQQRTENPDTLEEVRKELDPEIPRDFFGSFGLALLHPGPPPDVVETSRPVERPAEVQPHASPELPLYRAASQGEAERMQRRILLRRFLSAGRRREIGRRDEQLGLQDVRPLASVREAPCFTVGGSGRRTVLEGQGRHDGMDHGDLIGPEGVGLRRADLLRRILHAMR